MRDGRGRHVATKRATKLYETTAPSQKNAAMSLAIQRAAAALKVRTEKNSDAKILSAVKLEGQPLAALLSPGDLKKLAKELIHQTFQPGMSVIEEGEVGDAFYIIKSGNVSVHIKAIGQVATLSEGAFFGEMALLNDEPRKATIKATSELLCLVLDRQTFTRLLGPLRDLLDSAAEKRNEQIKRASWRSPSFFRRRGTSANLRTEAAEEVEQPPPPPARYIGRRALVSSPSPTRASATGAPPPPPEMAVGRIGWFDVGAGSFVVTLESGSEVKVLTEELEILADDSEQRLQEADAHNRSASREHQRAKMLQDSALLLAKSPCVSSAPTAQRLVHEHSLAGRRRFGGDEDEYLSRSSSKEAPPRRLSQRTGAEGAPWDWHGEPHPRLRRPPPREVLDRQPMFITVSPRSLGVVRGSPQTGW